MNVDLIMVREAHRSASTLASVRRADREGEWDLVSAQPGRLRSHSQSFRVGAHIEPAWDHATLRHRVAELVNATRDAMATDPVRAISRFLHRFVRAQPFLGQNERVALIAASAILRANGLPAFVARATARDPEFGRTLAATDDAMERLVERLLWDEALALAEWVPLVPAGSPWTLADEHAALTSARTSIALGPIMDEIVEIVTPLLGTLKADAASHVTHATWAARMRVAIDAAYRGHPICPHHDIIEVRWSIPGERDAVVVVALAGRGIARAASVHLSIEHPHVVAVGAPGLLLPIYETSSDRVERLASWLPFAIQTMA